MMRLVPVPMVLATLVWACAPSAATAQQFADPQFDPKVDRPAFTDRHPVVLIDEAHNNFHTADGRYKAFADLLRNDGFEVRPLKEKLSAGALKGCAILVIANAMGAPAMRNPAAAGPAFQPAECDAVNSWVRAGGSLLLIADHHPWGASNETLARRLGIDMGMSATFDPANSETYRPAWINYTRVNGLLGDHPIIAGRDGSERIDRVLTFAGQSVKGPAGSVPLLKLAASAADQPGPGQPGRVGAASGRAQGVAFALGRGRVVVLGEAGMLGAQVAGRTGAPIGMNFPGVDNRQFALNTMHWLAGLKFPERPVAVAAASSPTPESAPEPVAATTGRLGRAAGAERSGTMTTKRSTTTRAGAARAAAAAAAETGKILSSAEIAAESEASIALISGDNSVGTGFVVGPGIVATNAHVIDGEFLANVRVRFPSAEKAQQGPIMAELVYEDTRRDLAFLKVKSTLPSLRIAPAYKFRKGEDVTVIGNPGAGGELVLENAISRGLMSTRTTLEGQRYYQLSIAVNPGNSGGPVFNSRGAVIGVVTRKSAEQEALAFCIPVEDLNLALEKIATFPPEAIARQQSQHRVVLAVKELGGGGALYSMAAANRRRATEGGPGNGNRPRRGITFYDAAIAVLERQTFPRLRAEVGRVRNDPLISQTIRDHVGQLADNLEKMRTLYNATFKPAPGQKPAQGQAGPDALEGLKATHRRLLTEVAKPLELEVPTELLGALEPSSKK